jgi:hypothetical protein
MDDNSDEFFGAVLLQPKSSYLFIGAALATTVDLCAATTSTGSCLTESRTTNPLSIFKNRPANFV